MGKPKNYFGLIDKKYENTILEKRISMECFSFTLFFAKQ